MRDVVLYLDRLHGRVRQNKWHRYFAVFCRLALAAGFFPSGFVKVAGERFTSLAVNHPMGNYLQALFETGFYYTFIGIIQMLAALLLIIPRTATLGAVLYFPVILNICILSLAVRFEGSLISSPLMVLANLYLLAWDYHNLKYILPFRYPAPALTHSADMLTNKFPTRFFAGVGATVVVVVLLLTQVYELMPRNSMRDCTPQCATSRNPAACLQFCSCIHEEGLTLDHCLDAYGQSNRER